VRRYYYSVKGQVVASLEGRILRKVVRGSLHQLRRPAAWAIDLQIFDTAKRDGALILEIYDTETGKTYWTPISTFDCWGFELDRGHGRQVALPLERWQVERG
jgi:hypothetical protein